MSEDIEKLSLEDDPSHVTLVEKTREEEEQNTENKLTEPSQNEEKRRKAPQSKKYGFDNRRTQSMSGIARVPSRSSSFNKGSYPIKRSGSRVFDPPIGQEGTQAEDSNTPEVVTDESGRRISHVGDLNKFEKSRVRRRNSLGALEMSASLFSFQRRQLLQKTVDRQQMLINQAIPIIPKKYKVMMLGDSGTGKSALVTRYSVEKWPLPWIPAVTPQPITIETERMVLELWDTSGRKEYDNIRQFTFLRSKVFMVCFTTEDRESLTNAIMKWIPMARNWSSTALVVLVCMKIDLREEEDNESDDITGHGDDNVDSNIGKLITYNEGRGISKEMEVEYLECTSTRPLSQFVYEMEGLIETHYNSEKENR